MKRVFEFYTGKGQQDITTLAESLECVRRSGKPTRITIEDLPESKPVICEKAKYCNGEYWLDGVINCYWHLPCDRHILVSARCGKTGEYINLLPCEGEENGR